MTKNEEYDLVALFAVSRLGGNAHKSTVCQYIRENCLIIISEEMETIRIWKGGEEAKWHNDIAWARDRLVKRGHFEVIKRGVWSLSEKGKDILYKSLSELEALEGSHILDKNAILKIRYSMSHSAISDENAVSKETEFVEGGKRLQWTTQYERHPELRNKAITIHGTECMGCGFDFENHYGDFGKGFIEVHHIRPVSKLDGPTNIDPERDLIVLCSNCHSMVHRKKESMLSLSDLRRMIKKIG